MSLDGYIASPERDTDWIIMDPEVDFGAYFEQFDTLLVGRKTYETMPGSGSSKGTTTYVFSRTLQQRDHSTVTIVGENARDIVAGLVEEPGVASPAERTKLTLVGHRAYGSGTVALEYAVHR